MPDPSDDDEGRRDPGKAEGEEDNANNQRENAKDRIRSLVTDEYLEILIRLANERFGANAERRRRFEENLFGTVDEREKEKETIKTEKSRRMGMRKKRLVGHGPKGNEDDEEMWKGVAMMAKNDEGEELGVEGLTV
jgi:tRNA wybutosine-synthesizing protein 3